MAEATSIYALCDPRTGEVRYVGKTMLATERRLRIHVTAAKRSGGRGPRRCTWIRSLAPERPVIRTLLLVPHAFGAEMERKAIAHFRAKGYRLTNLTDGGEGAAGRDFTASMRAALRAANLGLRHGPQSEEHRAKISAGLKAIGHCRGRALTSQHKARVSAGLTGLKPSAETRAKMSAAHRGIHHTAQSKARMSQRARARVRTPLSRETRVKLGVAMRAVWARRRAVA